MKRFDKFILWLFSLIILFNVVFTALLVFDLFGAREILEGLPKTYYALIATDKDVIIASIGILALLFILALKGFLFQSKIKKDKTDGILLENNNGKLLISRETLENLVRDISKKIEGTESIHSKIYLDENNEIVVNINAIVFQDAVIKEVTKKMQEDIKHAIKQASDLEVSEVNVNIERISSKVSPDKKTKEDFSKTKKKTDEVIAEAEKIKEIEEAKAKVEEKEEVEIIEVEDTKIEKDDTEIKVKKKDKNKNKSKKKKEKNVK